MALIIKVQYCKFLYSIGSTISDKVQIKGTIVHKVPCFELLQTWSIKFNFHCHGYVICI